LTACIRTSHQVTLNGQHTLKLWSFDELIGYSDSRFANPVQTTLGWDQYDQTVSYSFANSRIPYLNFGYRERRRDVDPGC
jgi:hypothetical protein